MNSFIKLFLFSQCILEVISNSEGTLKADDNPESYETRVKKSILKNMPLRWTFPIDYHIRNDVNKITVKAALGFIERETCIRFRETTNFSNGGLNYINGSSGCASYVGKISNGKPQDIVLGSTCDKVTTAVHETCHALGVIHEMTRHDRDSYIDVKFANIEPRVTYNFLRYDLTSASPLGLKYDFGSVMHYDRTAGSANGQLAMEPKYESYLKTIGQSTRVGFNDMKQLNIHYCNSKCKKKLKCQMGGYTNPNNCSVCKCPAFYTGVLCAKLLPSHKQCGATKFKTKVVDKELIATGIKTCYFQITAPVGRRVQLNIVATNLYDSYVCQPNRGLEVKFLADKSVSGAMICGRNFGKIITSQNNVVVMKYVGVSPFSGIKIRYRDIA